MRSLRKTPLLLLIGIILILTACKKGDDTTLTPLNTNISIAFFHTVNDEVVEFDNIKYVNAYGNQYSVVRLQYFISDIILTRDDNTKIFIDEEFYVDGREPSSHYQDVTARIPFGQYIGLEFVFGLSEEKNIAGRYPNPPENNMEWPPALGTGYHYMKLEGKIDSSGVVKNFQAHTGPSFGNQNYIRVELKDAFFMISESATTIGIQMDINKWWQDPNTLDLNEITMVMGKQDIQQQLHDNGLNVFSYEPIIYTH